MSKIELNKDLFIFQVNDKLIDKTIKECPENNHLGKVHAKVEMCLFNVDTGKHFYAIRKIYYTNDEKSNHLVLENIEDIYSHYSLYTN